MDLSKKQAGDRDDYIIDRDGPFCTACQQHLPCNCDDMEKDYRDEERQRRRRAGSMVAPGAVLEDFCRASIWRYLEFAKDPKMRDLANMSDDEIIKDFLDYIYPHGMEDRPMTFKAP